VEPELGVLVHGPVVVVGRLAGVLEFQVEVANAIEDGQVGVGLRVFLLRLEDLQPRLDRAPRISGLEAFGLVFQLLSLDMSP